MITKEQLRAARSLLDYSQAFVAEMLGFDQRNISNLENEDGEASGTYALTVAQFYESRGIEFLEFSGVRKHPSGLRVYRGPAQFREFYDDLYDTAKTVGGDICLSNSVSQLVIGALGDDFVAKQKERMIKIKKNYRYRVIFAEGDDVFFGADYCEYRWIPPKFFNETAQFIFGNKVGFAHFENNDVEVTVLEQSNIAESQKLFFNYLWDIASEPEL